MLLRPTPYTTCTEYRLGGGGGIDTVSLMPNKAHDRRFSGRRCMKIEEAVFRRRLRAKEGRVPHHLHRLSGKRQVKVLTLCESKSKVSIKYAPSLIPCRRIWLSSCRSTGRESRNNTVLLHRFWRQRAVFLAASGPSLLCIFH